MTSNDHPSEIARSVVSKASTNLISKLDSLVGTSKDNIRLALGLAFEDYLAATYRRISNIRTLLTKDKQVSLLSIYVNLNLSTDDGILKDVDLLELMNSRTRMLIQGTGGAGKSMLLRYLVTLLLTQPNGRAPLFLELRTLTYADNTNLEDTIFEKLTQNGNTETKTTFMKAVDTGLVTLFLDGLDEIPTSSRTQALDAINSFSARYPNVCVFVSSRPGVNRESLPEFQIFNVLPLSLEQAILVVERTNADEDIKREFIKRLEDGLYEQHDTFLGIPLLVVMMLLTYSNYSDIPDRVTVFYEQAFSTLYALHDTVSKGPYKREHFAKLSPDEFSKVFECFCYLTLSNERYDFLHHEITDFVNKALKLSQVSVQSNLFLEDLEESVCLIARDGVQYVFAHRSFQEFFAAKFVLRYSSDNQYNIIDNIIGRGWQHNTIQLLEELDAIKFREKWILPASVELLRILDDVLLKSTWEAVKVFASGLHIFNDRVEPDGTIPEDIEVGYLPTDTASSQRMTKLGFALSRLGDLPTPYSVISVRAFLGETREEIERLAKSLDAPNEKLNKIIEFVLMDPSSVENKNDNDDLIHRVHSVDFEEEDDVWLSKSFIMQHIRSYRDQVSVFRDKVHKLVTEQKALEVDLL